GILSPEEIRLRFIQSARSILLDHDLVRAEHRWQITALELYLFHPEVWPDDSTDSDDVQLERGRWYVYTDRFATQWRIDITAGSKSGTTKAANIHASLLIAAIGKDDGSGIALNTILHGGSGKRNWNYSSPLSPERNLIRDTIHNCSVYSTPPNLRLERRLP